MSQELNSTNVFDEILENEESETSILVNAYDQACVFLREVVGAHLASPSEDSKQMVIEASDTAIYALRMLVQHLLDDKYVNRPDFRAIMVANLLVEDLYARDNLLSTDGTSSPNENGIIDQPDELASKITEQILESWLRDDVSVAAASVANAIIGYYGEYATLALGEFI